MKINRHDARLDSLLGKKVKIEFTDGDVRAGTLGWNERMESPSYMHPQMYFITTCTGMVVEFRKKHVKSVEEVR